MGDFSIVLEHLIRMEGIRNKAATAAYAVISIDKKGKVVVREQLEDVCHARLNTNKVVNPSYVLNFMCDEQFGWERTEEVRTPFLFWLLNDSPYADIFLTKDVEFVLKYGQVCHTNTPGNKLASALVLTRILWEWPEIAIYWKELVDYGVQPDLAILAAHSVKKSKNIGYIIGEGDHGHKAFAGGQISEAYVKNFLANTPANPEGLYNKKPRYVKVHGLWGDDGIFFGGYKAKSVKKIRSAFGGADTIIRYDASLKPFAEWLKKWYEREVLKPSVKRTGKRELYNNTPIIKAIKVGRTLNLAKVREIRKNLREELDRGVAVKDKFEGWNPAIYGRNAKTINDALLYRDTILGVAYWREVNNLMWGN